MTRSNSKRLIACTQNAHDLQSKNLIALWDRFWERLFNREWCGLCRTLIKRGGRHDATVKQFCDFPITHPNNIA